MMETLEEGLDSKVNMKNRKVTIIGWNNSMQGDTLAEYAEKVLLIIQYAVVSVHIECIIGARGTRSQAISI